MVTPIGPGEFAFTRVFHVVTRIVSTLCEVANLSFRLGSTMTNLPLPDDTFDGSFPVSVGFLLGIDGFRIDDVRPVEVRVVNRFHLFYHGFRGNFDLRCYNTGEILGRVHEQIDVDSGQQPFATSYRIEKIGQTGLKCSQKDGLVARTKPLYQFRVERLLLQNPLQVCQSSQPCESFLKVKLVVK